MSRHLVSNLLGLVGAIIGGAIGFYTFDWLRNQNLYGLMIPGALLGLGSSLLARHRSVARGVVCGLAALGLGIYTEWKFWPFRSDESFSYFLRNITSLKTATLLMIAFGAVIATVIGREAGFGHFSSSAAVTSERAG